MSPAEKLDEIVRLLDSCYFNLDDPAGEIVRALTLARELRDNAGATRMACPSCKRVDTNVYGGTICPKCWAAHVVPALLILSDPTP